MSVSVDYLVGAAGAGGASDVGGGGGAGQIFAGTDPMLAGSYPVVVPGVTAPATDGGNASWNGHAATGGHAGTATAGHGGNSGDGVLGGTGDGSGTGGGGGGEGGQGGNTVTTGTGGIGGTAVTLSISGSAVSYGGGGGGGGTVAPGTCDSSASAGSASGSAGDAPVNRCGGGGGGGSASAGGQGGSGVVILSYVTGTAVATGGSITTSGGRTIHTFNSSGTFAILAVLAASGVGAASFGGQAIFNGVESSAGVGAMAATGKSTATAVFAAAGSGVASPVGKSTATASLAASGAGANSYIGFIAQSYKELVLSDHPVVYYRLDEPSGVVAADSSGNGYDGGLNGGITLGQAGGTSDGDKAMLFNGSSGYISTPHNAAFAPTGDFTVEAWVKVSGNGQVDLINHYGTSPTFNGFIFGVSEQVNGKVSLWTGSAWFNSASTVNDGNWHYLVATLIGTTAKIYIDGILDATSGTLTPALTGVTHALEIGRRYDQGVFSGAAIDEVALYTTGLSAARVAAHYTAALQAVFAAAGSSSMLVGSSLTFAAAGAGANSYVGKSTGRGVFAATGAGVFVPVVKYTAPSVFATSGAGDAAIRSTRLGDWTVSINGAVRGVRLDGTGNIRRVLKVPMTATFTLDGVAPLVGEYVTIKIDGNPYYQFKGSIVTVDQLFDGDNVNSLVWQVSCNSANLLNRRMPFGAWVGTSASTVAPWLIANFTTGFTSAHVQAALPNVDIAFDGTVDVFTCLKNLGVKAGCLFYFDDADDLHFYQTESPLAVPSPLDIYNTTMQLVPQIKRTRDMTQLSNRVFVTGAAANVLTPTGFALAANPTVVPLDDASGFDTLGGAAVSNGDRFTYASREVGGAASTVVSDVAGPSGAPSAALASGAGVLAGNYKWKVALGNASGETVPGPASNQLTTAAFAAPTAPSVGDSSSSLVARLFAGVYQYLATFVTALGETSVGASVSKTMVDLPVPTAVTATQDTTKHGVLRPGSYNYKTTFVTQDGESSPATSAGNVTVSALASIAISGLGNVSGGLLGAGVYLYKATSVTAEGETLLGSSATITLTSASAPSAPTFASAQSGGALTSGTSYSYKCSFYSRVYGESPLSSGNSHTPSSPNLFMTWNLPSVASWADGIRLYRSWASGPYQLVGTTNASTFQDGMSDTSALGNGFAPIDSLVAGRQVTGTIGVSSETNSQVLARRLYRTAVGGSVYYLVAEIQDNSTTAFTDNVADAALTKQPPLVDTTGRQVSLSSTPTGGTGVTRRRVYRTAVGGSSYFYVGEVPDNSTTTFQDNVPDSSLVTAMPATNTAGTTSSAGNFKQPLLTVPTGASGTVARRIYRTTVGGSEYKLIGTIGDNTTTTFQDNVPDGSLGITAPVVNTAGANQAALTSIPVGGTGITQRVLYRTKAGGSDYYYVATINDNVTTTFTDNVPDTSLGRIAKTASTIGALAGDTTLVLAAVAGFPTSGWVKGGSQMISYTGISSTTLTGVPASGLGAISADLSAGTAVVTLPMLTGVSGLAAAGDQVNLFVQVDDAAAQAVLGAVEFDKNGNPTDGVHEWTITDTSLTTSAACTLVGNARLALYAYPIDTLKFVSDDPNIDAGRNVHVDLPIEGYLGDYMIQDVTIPLLDVQNQYPLMTVVASNVWLTVEDLLLRI